MPRVFELAVDANLENLGEIRTFIRQAGAALGVRDDVLGDLCLVVESPHLDESLAERKPGGMGVYLIRKLTDEAVYRPRAGRGNELRLVKRRAIAAA